TGPVGPTRKIEPYGRAEAEKREILAFARRLMRERCVFAQPRRRPSDRRVRPTRPVGQIAVVGGTRSLRQLRSFAAGAAAIDLLAELLLAFFDLPLPRERPTGSSKRRARRSSDSHLRVVRASAALRGRPGDIL